MAQAAAALLAVVLIGLAGFAAWSQLRVLRRLPAADDERRFYRWQAYRRLAGAVVLAALAAMLVGAFALGLEARMDELGAAERPLAEGQRRFVRDYAIYWSVVLGLVFVTVVLAAWDLWAIRVYAMRHHRRIRDDRNAMLERQLAEMKRERRERNGRLPPPAG